MSTNSSAIQESKLTTNSKEPVFKDYALYRKDRGTGRGGGLIMLIHHSIPYTIKNLPPTSTTGSQAITIGANGTDINIINIYIPPQSVCPSGFSASILQYLTIPNVVLLEDVNAHDALRYSSLEDFCRESLASKIENSGCGTLNLDTPTRRRAVESYPLSHLWEKFTKSRKYLVQYFSVKFMGKTQDEP
ncbi:hypothetical protein HELRODRAFT_169994 [Helobdella robusta]|uniref:Endonuclease/exonuclease/phosphatase domain-containing protein n=1 Tax=Helobdella robusta TaxID=6412 RepID=T1F2I2_HELRO|nr:hypothetical protein HELRODRAFT_169994 [Helobdella robusta]ESO07468.1 hypothetical protein HELRODRAFT_169994 [Helobdella robusta]